MRMRRELMLSMVGKRGAGNLWRVAQPVAQPAYAFLDPDTRRPAGEAAEFARVAHIIPLIARPPLAPFDGRAGPLQLRDELQQLDETRHLAGAASDVKSLSLYRAHFTAGEDES